MDRILITGAGSFIGTNFLRYSKFKNAEAVSLIDKKPGDINFNGIDIVIHLAAIVHQSKKILEQEYFRVNYDLCLQVAESAKKAGVKQFIFMSTVKVYGDAMDGSGIRNETSECNPDDPYGKSKYEAEKALLKISDKNFMVSVIRSPLVYGEGVKANMMSLIRLVDTLPILPLNKIDNKRNFTFVENLVGFIDRIIEKKISGIFIAMDENSLSTSDLVYCISRNLNKKIYLFKFPGFAFKLAHLFIPAILDRLFESFEFDNKRTTHILDFKPPYSTEEGIRKTVEYYIRNTKNKKN